MSPDCPTTDARAASRSPSPLPASSASVQNIVSDAEKLTASSAASLRRAAEPYRRCGNKTPAFCSKNCSIDDIGANSRPTALTFHSSSETRTQAVRVSPRRIELACCESKEIVEVRRDPFAPDLSFGPLATAVATAAYQAPTTSCPLAGRATSEGRLVTGIVLATNRPVAREVARITTRPANVSPRALPE